MPFFAHLHSFVDGFAALRWSDLNDDGSPGRVVENRGSGCPTINRALEKALMGKPIARSTLDEYDIIFQHRRMTEEEGHGYSKGNVEEAILGYFAGHESASTAEVARVASMSTKAIGHYISRLVGEGTLEAIGTKNSPRRRYRLA